MRSGGPPDARSLPFCSDLFRHHRCDCGGRRVGDVMARIGFRPHKAGQDCYYCGCATFSAGSTQALAEPDAIRTVDHYLPRVMGVGDDARGQANTVVACRACNTIKAGWPPEVFEWFIRQPQLRAPVKQRAAEFNRFCHTLTLAGFRAAVALWQAAQEPPKPSVFTFDIRSLPRDPRGRFVPRAQQ
jgi:hypothetical protein